jgi:hypothetical protein
MIIFDLDGTLADCEHRRHFVDERKNIIGGYDQAQLRPGWKPDWQAFYEACDLDTEILPIVFLLKQLRNSQTDYQIWSGRCESVRKKTEAWLWDRNIDGFSELKMRPIRDNTPDDHLKERWLDEYLNMPGLGKYRGQNNKVDFVFDDRSKVVRMWRRRGIFVFDVNQTGKEF